MMISAMSYGLMNHQFNLEGTGKCSESRFGKKKIEATSRAYHQGSCLGWNLLERNKQNLHFWSGYGCSSIHRNSVWMFATIHQEAVSRLGIQVYAGYLEFFSHCILLFWRPNWVYFLECILHCRHPCYRWLLLAKTVISWTVWCSPFFSGVHSLH